MILIFGSVDYAEIPVLDLGLVDLPGGKEKLVAQLKDAVEQTGMATSFPAFSRQEGGWGVMIEKDGQGQPRLRSSDAKADANRFLLRGQLWPFPGRH